MKNMERNSTIKLHTFEELKELFSVYITNKDSRKKIEEAYEFVDFLVKAKQKLNDVSEEQL